MSEDRLYIKVILQDQAHENRKQGGGGKREPFKTVTKELRQSLAAKVRQIENLLGDLPSEIKSIPARITLEEKAIAKTHTPTKLFNENTWQIIGKAKPNELFVKVTKPGSQELSRQLEQGISSETIKAISSISNIEAITPETRLGGISPKELFAIAPIRDEKRLIKIKLFSCADHEEQLEYNTQFQRLIEKLKVSYRKLDIFQNQDIYQIECDNTSQIDEISKAIFVRSVTQIPTLKILRDQNSIHRPMPNRLSQPDPQTTYPIVAIVDSGINRDVSVLNSWIFSSERMVAKQEENTYHGTFVAGLVVWGDTLNSALSQIDKLPCKILDVQILPNGDPNYGKVGILTESELIQGLEDLLAKYCKDVKVWNLSLGTDEICSLDKFSDFAIQLDELQEKYEVSFVLAAGNCDINALKRYPRNKNDLESARITAPADSVLGISVGAVSQIDHLTSGSKYGEPAPFSRNGPGPNYIIKPDFTHYGGNIGIDGQYALGITSVSGNETIGDNVGTSFATPFVSRKLAHIYHQVTPTPSPSLARALLTHGARDIRTLARVPDEDHIYLGFGTPTNIDKMLQCEPWYTTLVFEEALREGYELSWDYFPFPSSLIRNGKFRGEIWMTLAYAPRRNPHFGSEYCETHVDAHFGVIKEIYDGDAETIEEKFEGQVPQEHSDATKLFESYQVEKFRKWSPVRTYHRLIPNGISGKRWKLKVNMISRHKYGNPDNQSQAKLFPAYLQHFGGFTKNCVNGRKRDMNKWRKEYANYSGSFGRDIEGLREARGFTKRERVVAAIDEGLGGKSFEWGADASSWL